MLTILKFLGVENFKVISQLANQRQRKASLFSILTGNKLHTGFQGTYGRSIKTDRWQRILRQGHMVGAKQ